MTEYFAPLSNRHIWYSPVLLPLNSLRTLTYQSSGFYNFIIEIMINKWCHMGYNLLGLRNHVWLESLYFLYANPHSDLLFCKYILHPIACLFMMISGFSRDESFTFFSEVQLFIFPFMCCWTSDFSCYGFIFDSITDFEASFMLDWHLHEGEFCFFCVRQVTPALWVHKTLLLSSSFCSAVKVTSILCLLSFSVLFHWFVSVSPLSEALDSAGWFFPPHCSF